MADSASALRLCVLMAALIGVGPARAHHSFAAIFDIDQPVELSGTVTSVDWANPHMHFSIQAVDENGELVEWLFECFPPNMLVRQGWRRSETLNPGDEVTVSGWRARIDPRLGAARFVTFPDGSRYMAGPPANIGGR